MVTEIMYIICSYKKIVDRGKLFVAASFLLCTSFMTGCSDTDPIHDVSVTETTETIAESMQPGVMSVTGLWESEVVEDNETTVSDEAGATDSIKDETTDDGDETTETDTVSPLSRIEKTARGSGYKEGEQVLSEPPEITYEYSDGYYEYYSFDYADEVFEVLHEYDNWKIFDSNKIRNSKDMQLICEALLDIYPVHGVDLESYRTPEDMAYEWIQHNIVYEMPLTDARYKESAANVDLDPGDQNKTIVEMFKDRQ